MYDNDTNDLLTEIRNDVRFITESIKNLTYIGGFLVGAVAVKLLL